jgi:hypothetical protein
MKTWLLILFLILLLGCKNDHDIKIGSYKSVKLNKLELGFLYIFKGINSYFIGSEIDLSMDSSFVYTTCGNIMRGSYSIKNDSLFLNVKSNRFRIDSLNITGFNGHYPTIPTKPIRFKIEDDCLIIIHHSREKRKFFEKLKFNVP